MTLKKGKSVKPLGIGSDVTGANLLVQSPTVDDWADVGNVGRGKTYNEVLQGNINDCFFIAALSAVAWGLNTKLSNPGTYDFYNITSINPDTGKPTVEKINPSINVNEEIPVDSNDKPVYAQIPQGGDIWAMLYEKAYAKFMDPAHPNEPNYAFIDGGNGWRALVNITGYTNGIEYAANRPVNDILTDLGLSTTEPKAITNRAAVAWTKSQGMPCQSLYASHTYSILGSYFSGGKKYIVLRNPYGNQTGGSIVKPEPEDGVSKDNINWLSKGINFSVLDDGIFAYDLDLFRQYFAKYGVAKA